MTVPVAKCCQVSLITYVKSFRLLALIGVVGRCVLIFCEVGEAMPLARQNIIDKEKDE